MGNRPWRYMTNEARDLKEAYQWEAKSQWKGKPLTGDICLDIRLYFDNHRKRDWDNFHKLSMDALTGIAWEDDSQIKEATVKMGYDKADPRIELFIHS